MTGLEHDVIWVGLQAIVAQRIGMKLGKQELHMAQNEPDPNARKDLMSLPRDSAAARLVQGDIPDHRGPHPSVDEARPALLGLRLPDGASIAHGDRVTSLARSR
jgi:hypothetical protein